MNESEKDLVEKDIKESMNEILLLLKSVLFLGFISILLVLIFSIF